MDIIGRDETFSEHGFRFRVSGVRPAPAFSHLTPCMKLHEIRCRFPEVTHAVAEYGLRPRPRARTRPL